MSTIPPPSSDDELVSAVLDGVATAEERARVLADPQLAAQLRALSAVRDAIAAPVAPLPPDAADRLIERALTAAAPAVAGAPPPPPAPAPAAPPPPSPAPAPAPPVSLDAARQGRDTRRRARWGPALLGVAALLLVGLVAVPLLGSIGEDDGGEQTAAIDASDEQSESAGDASDAGGEALFETEPTDADDGAAAEDSAPGMTLGARPQPSPVDLGAHDDVEALADVAVEAGPVPVDPTAPGCATEPAGDRLVLRGEAEVDGDPVVVEVWWTDGADDAVVQVVDAATCDVVDELSRPR